MNVLIVDDEIVAVNALKRRVDWKSYGFTDVYCANDLRQAQKVFTENTIDLMLCDIEMPGGSGLDLFEWVKCHYPWVECIYVTCHPEFEYIRKALQLGSLDYILKPIDYEELDSILKMAVERILNRGEIRQRAVHLPENISDTPAEPAGAVSKAREYIEEHLKENLCVDDIAGTVYLNSQYLMRIFKKETGMSILEYITSRRIENAKILLSNSDYSITRVAAEAGYANYSYFIRLFKRTTGMTPAAWREKYVQRS